MDKSVLKQRLKKQCIETPSWGYADSGTRFGKFVQNSAARTLTEKLEDAGQVQKYTGICPVVALHIPWDIPEDGNWDNVKDIADGFGVRIGAINTNVFESQDYKWGSFGHTDKAIRQQAIDHHIECIDIANTTGSYGLSLWYGDGSNYPGQVHFRRRRERFQECLVEVYSKLTDNLRMLLEYKFFEPSFYHTDVSDWGQSLLFCQAMGERAQVLVDTGHHPTNTNIEHIVATLMSVGRLGGFHFNNRKYADDDLTVGSINPYEIFLIFNELVDGELSDDEYIRKQSNNVAYMFDQSHNLKNKIEATIQSAVFCQETYAKALMVDRAALYEAQENNDVLVAEEILKDAYNTDVRPLLRELREEMGIDPDPVQAFRRSGYTEAKAEERVKLHGVATGGGYQ